MRNCKTRYNKLDLQYVKIFWDAPKLKGEKVMDFIRKNWSRLSLAFIYLIGTVIAVVAWVNNWNYIADSEGVAKFFFISMFISTIMFFLGMVCISVVKAVSCSKKAVSAIYMAMGGVISVLLLVFIIVASSQQFELVLFTGNTAVVSLYFLWVPFIVFGLYPLVKGVTRFIEATNVPAKVAAQPVAQSAAKPANETVAEAPKATAKKTAPKAKAKAAK